MNRYENEANDKAVDSLLNYETVKYFCAEGHEIQRYDKSLENLGYATQRSQFSLALLNIGQAAIIAIGQFSVMLLAAYEVTLGPEQGMTAVSCFVGEIVTF
jgi:ABC-type transport system involved in Fe-S cluster assembly fused permease/ATPase subunit